MSRHDDTIARIDPTLGTAQTPRAFWRSSVLVALSGLLLAGLCSGCVVNPIPTPSDKSNTGANPGGSTDNNGGQFAADAAANDAGATSDIATGGNGGADTAHSDTNSERFDDAAAPPADVSETDVGVDAGNEPDSGSDDDDDDGAHGDAE